MRWECGECTDGCLDSFVVGAVRVEGCDTYCEKDGVLWQWCWHSVEDGVEGSEVFEVRCGEMS